MQERNYMRLDTLKLNNYTFKKLTKEAKLIYCFLEAHCTTPGFVQADESDIAYGIGLERRSGLNRYGRTRRLRLYSTQGDYDFILVKGTHESECMASLK